MLDGIIPNQGDVEKSEVRLPKTIPDDVIFEVDNESDVDELPRGALARLMHWDEDLALDLMVSGAGLTIIDRATHDALQEHDEFDPDGFGVIDDEGLWLPGLDQPYVRSDSGWDAPESLLQDSEE